MSWSKLCHQLQLCRRDQYLKHCGDNRFHLYLSWLVSDYPLFTLESQAFKKHFSKASLPLIGIGVASESGTLRKSRWNSFAQRGQSQHGEYHSGNELWEALDFLYFSLSQKSRF